MKNTIAIERAKLEKGESRFEEKKKRGRWGGTKTVEIETVKVVGYSDDETAIHWLYTGIMITISRVQMTAQEANDAYAKRDCVENTFEALKSHLGMDKIGVTT